jgi:3-hydroxymyristoyl/3-hydroxydecanoyl-(acyl carrier protein) dehydratase
LILEVKVLKERRELFVMRGEAKVDGETASEAELTAVVRPRARTGAE